MIFLIACYFYLLWVSFVSAAIELDNRNYSFIFICSTNDAFVLFFCIGPSATATCATPASEASGATST